ncbi:uncharacterized protein Bfra_001519 [Botrytis fragariae]|uniref:Rhodopsin domain-containing protein n=1 Tax=Botrytis fragariae TaxID=1964551 RepID=A0A8H6ELY3_9HELO|nr:uncharacterized protein Bfra_001519 [Botrytis fragariae]KAF5877156.1 hypothetical protein Bfra_001519 [Botrytis fragariae]
MWCNLGIIYVRIRTFRHLSSDGFCVIVAWILLLSCAIICQKISRDMYEMLGVLNGVLLPPPEKSEKHAERFLRGSAAVYVLYCCALWLIKISFLLFLGRLLENVDSYVWPRRIVAMVVFGSWMICIGIIPYSCLIPSFVKISATCQTRFAIRMQHFALGFGCGLDVLTDTMIMAIPISMLWAVRLSRKRKLALAGCHIMISMIFAIVRVAIVSSHSHRVEESWLYTWSFVEKTVAIVVACLASFRSLFSRQNTSQPTLPDPYERYESEENRQKKKKRIFDIQFGLLSRLTNSSVYVDINKTTSRSTELEDVLLHRQKIDVRQDVELQCSDSQTQAT